MTSPHVANLPFLAPPNLLTYTLIGYRDRIATNSAIRGPSTSGKNDVRDFYKRDYKTTCQTLVGVNNSPEIPNCRREKGWTGGRCLGYSSNG